MVSRGDFDRADKLRFSILVISLAAAIATTAYSALSLRRIWGRPKPRHIEAGGKPDSDHDGDHGTPRTTEVTPLVVAHALVLMGCLFGLISLSCEVAIHARTIAGGRASLLQSLYGNLRIVSFVFSFGEHLLLFTALLYAEERCFAPASVGWRKKGGRLFYGLYLVIWILTWATVVAYITRNIISGFIAITVVELLFEFYSLIAAVAFCILLAIKVFNPRDVVQDAHRKALVGFARITLPVVLYLVAMMTLDIAEGISPRILFRLNGRESELAVIILYSFTPILRILPLWAIVRAAKQLHAAPSKSA